jgi:transposase
MEEERTLYQRLDEDNIKRDSHEKGLKRAGRILILSDLDIDREKVLLMYKQRGGVENLFDTYKNVLKADKMYLQDDESVFGHLFAAFLSLYGYCRIEAILKSARLLSRISPMDLLEELSIVYIVGDGEVDVISEVPRKVAELEEKLGCDVFPK